MHRRIAIYLTCTDDSVLKAQFPNYAQMLETVLSPHLPKAVFEHFDVTTGVFPDDPTAFDAVVVTGSVANVSDDLPWMETLFEHIRKMDAAKTKLLGICFGHQAIATALGGRVEPREVNLGAPQIAIGAAREWMVPERETLSLFAGNFQQVVELPDGMRVLAGSVKCPNTLTEKGNHVLSMQYHPEFSAEYMRGYVALVEDKVGQVICDAALAEIDTGHDGALFGQWAAQFLAG